MILIVSIVSHKMYYFNLHIVSHPCFNLAQHLAKHSISIFFSRHYSTSWYEMVGIAPSFCLSDIQIYLRCWYRGFIVAHILNFMQQKFYSCQLYINTHFLHFAHKNTISRFALRLHSYKLKKYDQEYSCDHILTFFY